MPRKNHPSARPIVRRGSSSRPSSRPARAVVSRRAPIGQHFLKDPLIAHDIVEAAGLSGEDDVLEVGPGHGALTEELLERAGHVTAVELDEHLAASLRRRFSDHPKLTVVNADVLDFSPAELLGEAGRRPPYCMVANLPYYITAFVFRHVLERGPRPRRMVVMVQREVAQSLTGAPSGFSLLGVSVQVFGAVELLLRVPPVSFEPRPRVDSAVVRVDVYPEPLVAERDLEGFFTVVRAGFRAPRKQLHNSLGSGLWLPPGASFALLESAGIDPMRRAGTLSVAEWRSLYEAYQKARPSFAE